MWDKYYVATSVDDALAALERWQGKARLIAGGTDLVLDVRQAKFAPECLVDTTGIPGIDAIAVEGEYVVVGANVTYHQLWTSPLINEEAFILAEAAHHVAAWSVQNVGTLAGNVVTAQPAGDGSIALLALDAEAEVAGKGGRQWLPVSSLFAGPGRSHLDASREMITRFRWHKRGSRQASAYERLASEQPRSALVAWYLGVELFRRLTRAIELKPGYVMAHYVWSMAACALRRFDEALRQLQCGPDCVLP